MTEQFPQPSGEFEWVQASWGPALRCRPLAAVAPHYFSTRALRLEPVHGGDRDNWTVLAGALDVAAGALVRLRQVHGAGVFEAAPFSDPPEADIAITDDPAFALVVKAADCVPTLLADRRSGAVSAVHAGWKGTASGAVISAVRALQSRYGTNPADLVAAIGPSIGPCCYEVGPDLSRHFSAHPNAPEWFSSDTRPRLDLWRANRDQLECIGVPSAQIHIAALCTFEHPQHFHSYRRDGAQAGRLVGAIRSAPGRKP